MPKELKELKIAKAKIKTAIEDLEERILDTIAERDAALDRLHITQATVAESVELLKKLNAELADAHVLSAGTTRFWRF